MVALSPSDGSRRLGRRFVRRSAALGEGGEGDRSADFGESRGWAGVEVLAAEAVAVAFERQDL